MIAVYFKASSGFILEVFLSDVVQLQFVNQEYADTTTCTGRFLIYYHATFETFLYSAIYSFTNARLLVSLECT